MKETYNKKLIEVNSHINNLTPQQIEALLDLRNKHLETENCQMTFVDLKSIIAYDHLACKKIQEKRNIDNTFKVYLNKLEQQLISNPLLFFSLPISKLNSNELRYYLPNIDIINKKCVDIFKRVQQIKEKIKSNTSISIEEINFLIKFLNYYITYDRVKSNSVEKNSDDIDIFKEVIKFLLKQKKLGLHSSSLVIKYFGYKKCVEENLDDLEINISRLKDNTLGLHDSNFVCLSKSILINTSFLNNSLEEYKRLENGAHEGIQLLHTIYHEIRHEIQDKEQHLNHENDLSYSMAMRRIFSQLDSNEYTRNYIFYDIESDANLYGYRELCKTMKEYMPESQILQNLSSQLEYKYALKKDFNVKLSDENKVVATGYFEKKMLDNFFSSHPEKLQTEYPQFKKFYNNDGTPIQLTDLLAMQHSSYYDNFFLNQIIARFKEDEGLYKVKIDGYTLEEKKVMLKNIARIIFLSYSKISFLKDRLTFNNHFAIKNLGVPEQEFLTCISKGYYKIARKYAYYAKKLIQLYPELSDNIHSIDQINRYIELINMDINILNKELPDELKIQNEIIPSVENEISRRLK